MHCDLLGIRLFQERSPEFPVGVRVGEEELCLVLVIGEGGQEVVNHYLNPLAEPPEPKPKDSRVIGIGGVSRRILLVLMAGHHSLPHLLAACQYRAGSDEPAVTQSALGHVFCSHTVQTQLRVFDDFLRKKEYYVVGLMTNIYYGIRPNRTLY